MPYTTSQHTFSSWLAACRLAPCRRTMFSQLNARLSSERFAHFRFHFRGSVARLWLQLNTNKYKIPSMMARKNQKKQFRDSSDNASKLLCDEALNHVKVFNIRLKHILLLFINWFHSSDTKSYLFQGQNYGRALTTYHKVLNIIRIKGKRWLNWPLKNIKKQSIIVHISNKNQYSSRE